MICSSSLHIVSRCIQRCGGNIKLTSGFLRFSSSATPKYDHSDVCVPSASSVAEFYAGKSVFITGGTGFVGKVYIQKLLYSCPDINQIYMLIRANNKDHARERVSNMVENSDQLFKKLQQERPNDLKKIVPVVGELCAPNLGIDSDDEKEILDKVSIVVHSAANINFNDELQTAYNYNFQGTKGVLKFAKRMKNVQAFIHMSTLFSVTRVGTDTVDEILYPAPMGRDKVEMFLKKFGHMKYPPLNKLGGCPNTYTFTKALAEDLIASSHGDIPVVIIRPAGVLNSKEEPYRGWIDCLNPPLYYGLAVGKGILPCVYTSRSCILNIVPVDYLGNLMIVAPTQCRRSNGVIAYNHSTSESNPVTYNDIFQAFIQDCIKNNLNQKSIPIIFFTQSLLTWRLATFISQVIPAYILDAWCKIRGKPTIHVKNQRRAISWSKDMSFFTVNSWRAKSENVIQLYRTMNDHDKRRFPFVTTDIRWDEYLRAISQGARNVLTKLKHKKLS